MLTTAKFAIGEASITTIFEQDLGGLNHLIAGASPDAVREIDWLAPDYATSDGELHGVVQATVIEINTTTIVVDTCVGNGKNIEVNEQWNDLDTDFIERFLAAGFNEADVDFVVCTHLHLDHVGWNTRLVDGEWTPTFPNATHLFCRAEYDYWAHEAQTQLPEPTDELERQLQGFQRTQQQVHRESVAPIVDAGLALIVDLPHEATSGVRLIPTPGHTPGHASVTVESGGERLVITGDAFHHPCQIARPDWSTLVDADGGASSATRRQLLADLVGTSTQVLGSHFSWPSVGRIIADGDSFRFDTAELNPTTSETP